MFLVHELRYPEEEPLNPAGRSKTLFRFPENRSKAEDPAAVVDRRPESKAEMKGIVSQLGLEDGRHLRRNYHIIFSPLLSTFWELSRLTRIPFLQEAAALDCSKAMCANLQVCVYTVSRFRGGYLQPQGIDRRRRDDDSEGARRGISGMLERDQQCELHFKGKRCAGANIFFFLTSRREG